MTSTIGVGVECLRTDQRDRKRLLRSSFSLPDVTRLNLTSHILQRGEQFSVSFERLLYCSVNIETLIRLTIQGTTVEFTLANSLLLTTAGSVEFVNPSNSTVTLPINVELVSF